MKYLITFYLPFKFYSHEKDLCFSCCFCYSLSVCFVYSYASTSIFNANVEALAGTEIGLGPICSKTGVAGDYTAKKCTDCNAPFGKYDLSVCAFCPN